MGKITNHINRLDQEPIFRSFVIYLIPALIGMFFMAINFVVDGIMVGNRLGSVALAGVGVVAPIYTIFLAISLWFGIGGATLYAQKMGKANNQEARIIFTHTLIIISIVTLIITVLLYIAREPLIYALGANDETVIYALPYMTVLIPFGFIYTVKNMLVAFIRSDGSPHIPMLAIIIEAIINIALNYIFLYIINMGVTGAAYSTIIAAFMSTFIFYFHFLKRTNNLKIVRTILNKRLFAKMAMTGLPTFFAELGIIIFTISHNITMEKLASTAGVAAFTIVNYIHSVLLLTFIGVGTAIQPLISYFFGSNNRLKTDKTVQLAIRTAIILGMMIFFGGQLTATKIVYIFGEPTTSIYQLAVTGIRLFFIGYLFMGVNFVLMTYYQSIANLYFAIVHTVARQITVMLILLLTFSRIFGVTGVWLVVPTAEFSVLVVAYLYGERHRIRGI